VVGWLHTDPWLLVFGTVALSVTLLVRRLRPISLALVLLLVVLLRPGYLPAAYITGALPFAALTAAGGMDSLWRFKTAPGAGLPVSVKRLQSTAARVRIPAIATAFANTLIRRAFLMTLVLVSSLFVIPKWMSGDRTAMTVNTTIPFRRAETWITSHVPRSDPLLVDNDVWMDLVDDGYQRNDVVWAWELDLDPAVRARFPGGWRQMDYIVASVPIRANIRPQEYPQLYAAIRHSVQVARFPGVGSDWVAIYRVEPGFEGQPPRWLPPLAASSVTKRPSGER